MGFFTDTTVCIGCKACEVACKQWNDLPADGSEFRKGGSYDHTGSLSAATWRHVRFVETETPGRLPDVRARGALRIPAAGVGRRRLQPRRRSPPAGRRRCSSPSSDRWVFMSDVCKHCTNAGCLDACPTGALIRTEFETVIVQPDVCNGCGYCVPSCPFGVIDRDPYDGRAAKCTLCYDRLEDGLEPACAKACPTDSIQFGPYDELVERAKGRVVELHERGLETAYLYGAGDDRAEQLAGGLGAFFLLTEPPERFGLPAQADSPIQENVPGGERSPASPPAFAAAARSSRRCSSRTAGAAGEPRATGRRPRSDPAREQRGRIDGRDITPAVGTRGEPGALAARGRGRQVGAAPSRAGATRAGRSCTGATRATRPSAARRRGGGGRARACAAARTPDVQVQGPSCNPPVWTWEVPLYFWFGGIATGSSFVGARRATSRATSARRGSRARWRSARVDAVARRC